MITLCHLSIFVFLISGNLDNEILSRIERSQADVACDALGHRILGRFLNFIVLEQVAVALVVVQEGLDFSFQVLGRVVGIPVFERHFVYVVHQYFLDPVEYADNGVFFHGGVVAVVEGCIVERHDTSWG